MLGRNSVRKIPTFYLSNTENFGSSSSLNGSETKRAGQQKSVVSISGTGNVDTYLTKVIPAPYPTKHRGKISNHNSSLKVVWDFLANLPRFCFSKTQKYSIFSQWQ